MADDNPQLKMTRVGIILDRRRRICCGRPPSRPGRALSTCSPTRMTTSTRQEDFPCGSRPLPDAAFFFRDGPEAATKPPIPWPFGWIGTRVWAANFIAHEWPGGTAVNPAAGSGAKQTFTATFSDPSDWRNLDAVRILFSQTVAGQQACSLRYTPRDNSLLLMNDKGDESAAGAVRIVLDSKPGALENGNCRIDSAGSSAVGVQKILKVTVEVTFKDKFAGVHAIYLAASNGARKLTGVASARHLEGAGTSAGAVRCRIDDSCARLRHRRSVPFPIHGAQQQRSYRHRRHSG